MRGGALAKAYTSAAARERVGGVGGVGSPLHCRRMKARPLVSLTRSDGRNR